MFWQKVTDNQQEMIDNQQVMLENQQVMISKQDEMIRQQMIGNTIATVNMMANIVTARNTSQIAANTADIAHHTQNTYQNTQGEWQISIPKGCIWRKIYIPIAISLIKNQEGRSNSQKRKKRRGRRILGRIRKITATCCPA